MAEVKFVADRMLGKLSRLLRMCGIDTTYCRGGDDDLVKLIINENRHLLTRNTQLIRRKDLSQQHLLIRYDHPHAQLHQVIKHYNLTLTPYNLCLTCNQKLKIISPDEAEGRVPDYVAHTQPAFSQCPHCKKIFWKGTHFENMQKTIYQLSGCSPISDI